MVVVPSAHDVTLHYGSSRAGLAGEVLFVGGLVALVVLLRRRRAIAPTFARDKVEEKWA